MSEKNIFEIATREQYRFKSVRGNINIEDLWDLPLTAPKTGQRADYSLEVVGRDILRELKESEEESLVATSSTGNITLKTKLEIVKHVIAVKLAEAEEAKNRRERKETKEKILNILAEKKDESLKSQSIESLEAMLASL